MSPLGQSRSQAPAALRSLHRFSRAALNYGDPIALAWQLWRLKSKPGLIRISDRATGIECCSRAGAFQMFGEVYHLHLYDIPWLPIRPGDLVIDIGANHGFYSLYAAHLGAKVLAFEPQKDTFELLQANIRSNGLQHRITAFPCAIGASSGTTTLSVSANLAGGMSTTSERFRQNSGIEVIDEYEVPVLSLEEVIAEHVPHSVRLIKLDCEGSELEILRNLPGSDWDRIQGLACELHPEAYAPAHLFHCIRKAGSDFQISTLDTLTHYGVGSAILHAVRSSCALEALADPPSAPISR